MGIDAAAKQPNASLLISGLGGVGEEIANNLVPPGCKYLTLNDIKITSYNKLRSTFLSI